MTRFSPIRRRRGDEAIKRFSRPQSRTRRLRGEAEERRERNARKTHSHHHHYYYRYASRHTYTRKRIVNSTCAVARRTEIISIDPRFAAVEQLLGEAWNKSASRGCIPRMRTSTRGLYRASETIASHRWQTRRVPRISLARSMLLFFERLRFEISMVCLVENISTTPTINRKSFHSPRESGSGGGGGGGGGGTFQNTLEKVQDTELSCTKTKWNRNESADATTVKIQSPSWIVVDRRARTYVAVSYN